MGAVLNKIGSNIRNSPINLPDSVYAAGVGLLSLFHGVSHEPFLTCEERFGSATTLDTPLARGTGQVGRRRGDQLPGEEVKIHLHNRKQETNFLKLLVVTLYEGYIYVSFQVRPRCRLLRWVRLTMTKEQSSRGVGIQQASFSNFNSFRIVWSL